MPRTLDVEPTTQETDAMTAAPGWYPAPDGAPLVVWWDGQSWTEWTQPAPDAFQQQMLQHARRSADNSTAIRSIIVTVIVLALIVYVVVRFNQNVGN